jgi:hypothetical protein
MVSCIEFSNTLALGKIIFMTGVGETVLLHVSNERTFFLVVDQVSGCQVEENERKDWRERKRDQKRKHMTHWKKKDTKEKFEKRERKMWMSVTYDGERSEYSEYIRQKILDIVIGKVSGN